MALKWVIALLLLPSSLAFIISPNEIPECQADQLLHCSPYDLDFVGLETGYACLPSSIVPHSQAVLFGRLGL